MLKRIILTAALPWVACTGLLLLAGCASVPPIQPANTSKSGFDGAVYSGTLVTVHPARPGTEAYRVFVKGATGFVSLQTVRDDAEERAQQFCARTGGSMEALTEHTSNPPHILGNFPRVEIVFDCVGRQSASTAVAGDAKYGQLANLKKLLDSGAITQTEFATEKAKILNGP